MMMRRAVRCAATRAVAVTAADASAASAASARVVDGLPMTLGRHRHPRLGGSPRASGTATAASGATRALDVEFEMKGVTLRGRPLYLDMQATTPLDPRVLDAMLPYMTEQYGNPHSRTHMYGWETEEAIERARKEVADLIGADAKEIVFTSG